MVKGLGLLTTLLLILIYFRLLLYSVHIVLVYIEVHSPCSSTERFLALVGQSLEVNSRSLHLM